ncbi:MAG TPA: hypothetical protein VF407_04530 [Polyangiaceae bacterium]
MRSTTARVFAALAFVALAACSAGNGSPVPTTAGPDGVPNASGDPSGPGGESPGTIFGDEPSPSGDQPGGPSTDNSSCLTCSGSYVCSTTTSEGSGTSHVTLSPAANGCAAGDDNEVLACNGDFDAVSKGQSTVIGHWSGSNAGFTVTATVEGQTVTATCVPGQGGGTVTPDVDAGTDDTQGNGG